MEIIPGSSGAGPVLPDLAASLADIPTVAALPSALLKPQIIEAVVLRNALLTPATPGGNSQTATPTLSQTPASIGVNLQQSLQSSTQATLLAAVQTNPLTNPQGSPQSTLQGTPQTNVQAQLPLLQTSQSNISTNLFRVVLQWQGQRIELVSPQPLPIETPVQIQITARNEFILRNTAFAALTTPQGNAATAAASTQVRLSSQPTPLAGALTSAPAGAIPSTASHLPLTLSPAATETRNVAGVTQPSSPTSAALTSATPSIISLPQRLQQLLTPLVRENLPRQQPLSALIPALRLLIAPTQQSHMPQALARAVLDLWQSLPTPKQLQQPATLKQALSRSGSFFEATVAAARAGQKPESAEAAQLSVPRILGTDLKAQIMVLLTILKSRPVPNAPPTETVPLATDLDATYKKPQVHDTNLAMTTGRKEESTDVLLQQLGKMLEAGLSRIHLNQLDSVLSRHPAGDSSTNIPTWVMEMPLQTQHGQQHVSVRIEEHNRKLENKKVKQWQVQLSFDLHELGKLAATLSIIDHSVGATLWAEREQTHHAVQREMKTLRKGLEAVGVNVTELHCRLGTPPERSSLIGCGLVDTHS